MKDLFKQHLETVRKRIDRLLDERNLSSLFIDNGQHDYYFLDDYAVPFKGNPHFAYLCPARGEGHILELRRGETPRLYFYSPPDFWHKNESFSDSFWADFFEIQVFDDHQQFWSKRLSSGARFISPQPELAIEEGFVPADQSLLDAMHWCRVQKTPYEILCLKKATQIASLGHQAAKQSFMNGASEFEIMQAYVLASGQRERELPYNNIIALNENGAILHYQHLGTQREGSSFLIDAGARFNSYCSDISRTYCRDSAHPAFRELIDQVSRLQARLVEKVKPGAFYPDLHKEAFEGIGASLHSIGVLKSIEAKDNPEIVSAFFPHGLGHPLGIQVHDVAGKQLDERGTPAPRDPRFPFLRTLRHIQENDVLTIEPGAYFIPQLLKPLREQKGVSSLLNWKLIDELIQFGGVRIEDDVWASANGPENITREYLS